MAVASRPRPLALGPPQPRRLTPPAAAAKRSAGGRRVAPRRFASDCRGRWDARFGRRGGACAVAAPRREGREGSCAGRERPWLHLRGRGAAPRSCRCARRPATCPANAAPGGRPSCPEAGAKQPGHRRPGFVCRHPQVGRREAPAFPLRSALLRRQPAGRGPAEKALPPELAAVLFPLVSARHSCGFIPALHRVHWYQSQ